MIQVPFHESAPFFDQVTNLDGTDYRFEVRYNQRTETYRISIGSPDGTVYAAGAAMLPRWPLFRNVVDPRMPPGVLMVVPLGGDETPPKLGELGPGKRCELFYIPASELAGFADE